MLGSTTSEHLEKSLVSILSFLDNITIIQSKPGQMEAILCSVQTCPSLLSHCFLPTFLPVPSPLPTTTKDRLGSSLLPRPNLLLGKDLMQLFLP